MKVNLAYLTQARGVVKLVEIILSSICIGTICDNRMCFLYDVALRMYGLIVASTFLSITFIIFVVDLFTTQHGQKPYLEAFLHGFAAVSFMTVVLWIRIAAYPQCFYEYLDIGISAALNAVAFGFDMVITIKIIRGIDTKKPLFYLLPIDGQGNSFPSSDKYELHNNEIA